MLDLIVGGYIPGTQIQISLTIFITSTLIILFLTYAILTWILQHAEKKLYKQVIEAIHDQLQAEMDYSASSSGSGSILST